VPVKRSAARRFIRHLAMVVVIAVVVVVASALASAFAQALGGIRPAPAAGIIGWILAKQALFYRALAGLIHAAKADGSAYWGLMGISFVYGIFHAAGPGHGKAVISSYLLANDETWRRGIALSFASALLQAITAIVLVAIVAVLIGATAKMMGNTVRVIEIVSYALIVLIGARLFWVKGRAFLHTLHSLRSAPPLAPAQPRHDHRIDDGHVHTNAHHHRHEHAHHEHVARHALAEHANHSDNQAHAHDARDHMHDDDEGRVLPWGHAHGPEPEELAGAGGWRRGLSAIVAVGLRPCSGAIIVLVFALAQGLFWAGIASTLVMGLGTAMTVAAIATLAVAAKAAAARVAATRAGYGILALRGVEVGATLLIMMFGVLLLSGYMVSERMGLF
jgi:nickel/cobalt transporter (NicO) family protein